MLQFKVRVDCEISRHTSEMSLHTVWESLAYGIVSVCPFIPLSAATLVSSEPSDLLYTACMASFH